MTNSNLASAESDIPCRRTQMADRRQSHFRATLVSFFNDRRKSLRRDATSIRDNYLQTFKPINLSFLMVIILLVGFDALISYLVVFMGRDVDTAMPLILANHALVVFLVIKSLVAGLFIFAAATYQNLELLRKLSKQRILYTITVVYLGLLLYLVSIL